MNKILEIILKKMFKMVNANFPKDEKYFKKTNWFLKKSWTIKRQEEFEAWMVDYLKDDKEARNYIMERPIVDKNILERVAREFTFDFGWSINLGGKK